MKLIICRQCQDVFKLVYERRTCSCGECWGNYEEDGLHAVYGGKNAVPIGFANDSLAEAIYSQPSEGWGYRFEAFVIPKHCSTLVKEEE